MSEFCKICGAEKIEGVCPNAEMHIKKMCINCNSCNEKDNLMFCNNEDNLKDATNAMLKYVPKGYLVETLTLSPIALKDPTKKCIRWTLNENIVLSELENL